MGGSDGYGEGGREAVVIVRVREEGRQWRFG